MALISAPIPGASNYASAALLAKTAYDKALIRNNQSTLGSMRNFGYNADVDPTSGMLTNLRVDSANPTGVYQNMLRSHAQTDQADREDAAGRGIYGGLAEQQRSNDRYGFAQDRAQLGSAVTGAFDQYGQNMQDASYQRDAALYEAQRSAAQDAALQEWFNQADFSGVPTPSYDQPTVYPPVPTTGQQLAPPTVNYKPPMTTTQLTKKAAAVAPKAAYVPGGSSPAQAKAILNSAIKTAQAQTTKKKK